jgi:hypothetical protein
VGSCRPQRRFLRLGGTPPHRGAPTTGAIQIVEVRERVEDFVTPSAPAEPVPAPPALLFRTLSADHLPTEAAEALLEYVGTGRLRRPAPVAPADPFAHPDALRRFRVVENQEALALALDSPWERWAVFLHPAQQGIVDRSYSGPARTSCSAGSGKTVVALHRAARHARQAPDGRVLLTTFSQPLANALSRKLAVLVGEDLPVLRRVFYVACTRARDRLLISAVRPISEFIQDLQSKGS